MISYQRNPFALLTRSLGQNYLQGPPFDPRVKPCVDELFESLVDLTKVVDSPDPFRLFQWRDRSSYIVS